MSVFYGSGSGGGSSYSIANVSPSFGTVNVANNVYTDNTDLVITRNGKKINVGESIEHILDRLAILTEQQEKHEKYPALKEAYDNYKLIEKLLTGDEND